jgi:hypothetical protein
VGVPDGATGPGGPGGFEFDRALARLEDVLLELPYDRAMPDLEVVLERAGVPVELLRRDDRVLKVLHEAIVSRPFGDIDDVLRTRTEVELCTLEVEVLTERLIEQADDPAAIERVTARLTELRVRLAEVQDRL